MPPVGRSTSMPITQEDLDGAVPGTQVQFYSQEYNGTHIGHVVGVTDKTLLCKLQRGKKWVDVTVRKAIVKAVYHATPHQEIAEWLEAEAEKVRQEEAKAQKEAEREARRQEALQHAAEIEQRRKDREAARQAVLDARNARKSARQKKMADKDAVKSAKKAQKEALKAELENQKVAREEKRKARQAWGEKVAQAAASSRKLPDCFAHG